MHAHTAYNERELFIATLLQQRPPRVPFTPGEGRESTLRNWHSQGLPPEITNCYRYVQELLGITPARGSDCARVDPEINFRMNPQFEEKVIERRARTLIVQDWKGNICEISDQYDNRYLRNAIDFVTRRWIRCPIESREDWAGMMRRYRADDPTRLPKDFSDRAKLLKDRDYVAPLVFPGPFWQLREWMGLENLCMAFVEQADFIKEMIAFWQRFVTDLLMRVFDEFVPDIVTINEDMAYKEKSMIGPQMASEFLLPCWRQWCGCCRRASVPIIEIDSDGHIGDLIALWIEAGVNCTSPLEVAAGNDLPDYRQRFGDRLAYRGGVDKRAIAAGGEKIRAEIARVEPVIAAGGYIPGCDHAVPANVSWQNYVDYCRLLAQATGHL